MSKRSAIKDIFNGIRGHKETMGVPQESQENLSLASDAYNELKEKLSTELLNLHQKYIDALESNFCDEVDFYFVEGFKLGLAIGIECME